VQSWPEIMKLAAGSGKQEALQSELFEE